MPCPEHHVAYQSETVARNAATLHGWAYPHCTAYNLFRCGDHWHVGHPSQAAGDACKADAEHRATRRRLRAAAGTGASTVTARRGTPR